MLCFCFCVVFVWFVFVWFGFNTRMQSITAGFAMKAHPVYDVYDLLDSLLEFRGSVYSIGGDAGEVTVPNFLAQYRGGVVPVGASLGTSWPLDAIKWEGHIIQPHVPDIDRLNGAQSQASAFAFGRFGFLNVCRRQRSRKSSIKSTTCLTNCTFTPPTARSTLTTTGNF